MPSSTDRVRYRDVLGVAEFRALLGCEALSVLGDQVARVAVALLVYARTGSALAAAATFAVSYLTWLVGGPLLSTFADRYPRRSVMVVCDAARALVFAGLAFSGGTTAIVLGLLVAGTLFAPPFESARSALLADVLPTDAYAAGNGLINAVAQGGQAAGFLLGGALVASVGSRNALLADAGTFLLSAVALRVLLRDRPLGRTTAAMPSVLADMAEGLALVRRTPLLRWLLATALLSAAMVTAPEGLAVPIARGHHGGAFAAGVLTAALPVGFVLGSFVVLRLPEGRRLRLLPALSLVSGLPLLCTPLMPGVAATAALWAAAGAGASLQVVANAAYVQAAPVALRGRAFGIASTLLLGTQGLVYLLAGAVAEVVAPATVVAVLAGAGLLLLPAVTRLSHPRQETTQVTGDLGRA
ncbi:MAG: major facilitator superfamily 1 [Frankiales bacterium]|nr:major facilitator superfamily 1 [Frankiales bacterium]